MNSDKHQGKDKYIDIRKGNLNKKKGILNPKTSTD